MAISKRLRFEILRRDGHACRYCGEKAPNVQITVDHVVPKALGGTDEPTNLVAACGPCNSGKSSGSPDAPLVADVESDAMRWQMAWAAAVAQAERDGKQREKDIAKVKRSYVAAYKGRHGDAPYLPEGWQASVGRWLDLGLPMTMIDQAISAAVGRTNVRREDRWSYLAGCCWGKLRDLADQAKSVADASQQADDDESTIEDRIAATFSGAWGHNGDTSSPTDEEWRTLDAHVTAANAAGYSEATIAMIARRAGADHDPRLADYFPTVNDVFDMADRGPANSSFKRLGITQEYAPNRVEREADAIAKAARLIWCTTWENARDEPVDLAMAREIHSAAWDLYPDEAEASEILRAAEWAAGEPEGRADLKGALAKLKVRDVVEPAHSAWENAWLRTNGTWPSSEDYKAVWDTCEALTAADACLDEITVAAVFAGVHSTTHLHYGLKAEHARAAGSKVLLDAIEDYWAVVWRRTHGEWPCASKRDALRANLLKAAAAEAFIYADANLAAVTAALAQSVDLRPGLTVRGSALAAAGSPIVSAL